MVVGVLAGGKCGFLVGATGVGIRVGVVAVGIVTEKGSMGVGWMWCVPGL